MKKDSIELPKEYKAWSKVFNKQESERLPKHQVWDHDIRVKPDFVPKVFKNYNMSEDESQ